MSLPTSIQAYADCLETFEKALATRTGIRVKQPDYATAVHFRMRLHQARKLHRIENAEIYEPGDKMYGCSEFDPYAIRIKNIDDVFYIYIEKYETPDEDVESLDEIAS